MGSFPNGVDEIITFLAMTASGFDNRLQWVEEAMFKADLMNTPARWRSIDAHAFQTRCLERGMRPEDAETLTRYLVRSKNGGKLAPQKNYRTYRFPQPVAPVERQPRTVSQLRTPAAPRTAAPLRAESRPRTDIPDFPEARIA